VVLGITVMLTADTEFEDVESCEELAAKLATDGAAHVEVEVSGQGCDGLVAEEVELEDHDNDGTPDDHDDDDDDNDDDHDDEDDDN
jgi:hypothetical protein